MFPFVGACAVMVALSGPARAPTVAEAYARDVERKVAQLFVDYQAVTAATREGDALSKALHERTAAYKKARAAEKAARAAREAENKPAPPKP